MQCWPSISSTNHDVPRAFWCTALVQAPHSLLLWSCWSYVWTNIAMCVWGWKRSLKHKRCSGEWFRKGFLVIVSLYSPIHYSTHTLRNTNLQQTGRSEKENPQAKRERERGVTDRTFQLQYISIVTHCRLFWPDWQRFQTASVLPGGWRKRV